MDTLWTLIMNIHVPKCTCPVDANGGPCISRAFDGHIFTSVVFILISNIHPCFSKLGIPIIIHLIPLGKMMDIQRKQTLYIHANNCIYLYQRKKKTRVLNLPSISAIFDVSWKWTTFSKYCIGSLSIPFIMSIMHS